MLTVCERYRVSYWFTKLLLRFKNLITRNTFIELVHLAAGGGKLQEEGLQNRNYLLNTIISSRKE